MTLKSRSRYLVVVMVAALGALASAQAVKKPGQKAPRVLRRTHEQCDRDQPAPHEVRLGGDRDCRGASGDVKTTRPGVAHYHVGIDQRCLPARKTIVKGTPSWVHFGDGTSEFDTQLTQGKHTLALQLGDDLYNTMPGTCTMMTVNVKP